MLCRLRITLYFTSVLHQIIFVLLVSIHYILCQQGMAAVSQSNWFGSAESNTCRCWKRSRLFWGDQNCIIQTSFALSQTNIESGQWKILSFGLQKPLCIQVSEQGRDEQQNRDNAASNVDVGKTGVRGVLLGCNKPKGWGSTLPSPGLTLYLLCLTNAAVTQNAPGKGKTWVSICHGEDKVLTRLVTSCWECSPKLWCFCTHPGVEEATVASLDLSGLCALYWGQENDHPLKQSVAWEEAAGQEEGNQEQCEKWLMKETTCVGNHIHSAM